ncbi:MAG: Gfo/Idh/MocA family oxidoreductase [Flavobacteriales bacterium]
MLKIGVLGAGHLGKIHLNCIQEIADYELVGFYDTDKEVSKEVESQYAIKSFESIEELIDAVDVVDIVTPTLSHFECAKKSIIASKHIFIEKPITNTTKEAKTLISLSAEANVKVQIGHVERFNPAFLSIQDKIESPMFVESHRLAEFNPRGTDVSVIHDLMIHDIDIILSIVKSNVKRISANGVAIVSETPDIANARIEFDNGCVANLTASRVSLKNMRKTRIFQKNAYISVDFSAKDAALMQLKNVEGETDPYSVVLDLGENKGKKEIVFEKPAIQENNAIKDELQSFANSIINNTQPLVTVEDGYNALRIASIIMEKMKFSGEKFSSNL